MEIHEIKSRLDIHTVLTHYGLQPNKNNMLQCPFHADDKPSMKIYTETNTFNCFGCGANGDVIEFIQRKENLSKHQALVSATALIGKLSGSELQSNREHLKNKQFSEQIPIAKRIGPIEMAGENHNAKPLKQPENQTNENHIKILEKIFGYFQNGLNSGVARKPKEYLQQRNLDYTKLETGYNSGQFHHRDKLSRTEKQACIDAGLLVPYDKKTPNAKGATYSPFAKDCIIFPLKNKQNRITGIYGRSITNNKNSLSAVGSPKAGKHFYLKNRKGLYPNYPPVGGHGPNQNTTKLILTEAIIDAATLLQLPEITKEFTILALYGTNGLTEEHKQAIKEWANGSLPAGAKQRQEIIFFFDGDKAGEEAIKKYQKELSELKLPSKPGQAGIKISKVETPEGEDVNSLYVNYDKDAILQLLKERKLPRSSVRDESFLLTEKVEEKQSLPRSIGGNDTQTLQEPPKETGRLNTKNPEFITFTTEELQIILLGGINLQQLDRLRATIKITRKGSNNPLHSIRHTLDLYHSDYLEKFINKASEQLETGTTVLRKALAELIDQIEKYRLTKIESRKEKRPRQRQLTDQQKRKAIKYLSSPKLMERTNTDIGKTGMVGEENNRLLMYLIFTSRLREQPLHIISLGASGTGKTYLQEKVSELIPEHHKLEITILSENAFYYFGQQELKNKLVLIEDMDGAENVLYPLRELQSKKKISKTIPIKDSKGNLKTITLKVEGPICLAGTTTREKLYEDNANRSLLIYLDSSKSQKEHIMNYQRAESAGRIKKKEESETRELFKDMQSMLRKIKVRNPFAEYLIIPEHVFKPLRTNSHYLAFIETITFYHQYQREVKICPNTGERYIETTLEDIEWANRLLKDVLLAKADELPPAVRTFFERLKSWQKVNSKEAFYSKEIRETFRMTSSSCNRYILELLRNNYIKISGGNKYRRGFEYQIIKPDEYQKLQQHIKTALDEALNRIKNKPALSADRYPGIPTVSQSKNGILKTNNTKALSPVSQ